MIRRALVALFLMMLTSCAASPGFRERPPFPVARLEDLSPIEKLGYEIYLQDEAAWQTTDLALANGLKQTPAQGWITLLFEGGWTVRFIGPCADEACAYVDVTKLLLVDEPTVTRHDAAKLSERESSIWRARQTALSRASRRCTEQINTAVIADVIDEKPVWRVYLLASSTDSDEVVLAGHQRTTVSQDGRTILAEEALSKSCLIDKFNPNAAALFVTHILHPKPIETHVFTSLTYRLPLAVGTSEGTFMVEGTSIRLISKR